MNFLIFDCFHDITFDNKISKCFDINFVSKFNIVLKVDPIAMTKSMLQPLRVNSCSSIRFYLKELNLLQLIRKQRRDNVDQMTMIFKQNPEVRLKFTENQINRFYCSFKNEHKTSSSRICIATVRTLLMTSVLLDCFSEYSASNTCFHLKFPVKCMHINNVYTNG